MLTFSYPQLSLLEEKQGGNNGTNIFAPTNYSTPACSPRRQMSEPPPPSDYVSSPRPSNRFVFCPSPPDYVSSPRPSNGFIFCLFDRLYIIRSN